MNPWQERLSSFGDQIAIRTPEQTWTYSQMMEEVSKCIEDLAKRSGSRLAFDISRSPELVFMTLAGLIAKRPFVILNPEFSIHKKNELMEKIGADFRIQFDGEKLVGHRQFPKKQPQPAFARPDDQLAYFAISSGSCSEIKAAGIDHRALLLMVQNQSSAFELTAGKRVLLFANPGYDALIAELFTSLWAGSEILILPYRGSEMVKETRALIQQGQVDMVTLTPSVARVLGSQTLAKLKVLVLAGEAADDQLVASLLGRLRLYNAYGPCETTCCTHVQEIRQVEDTVCLSHPLPHVCSQIVKENGDLAEEGEVGEMIISGASVGLGYLGEDGNDRFSFNTDRSVRSFKTGDLFQVIAGNKIAFKGRRDLRVKIRGQSVDLRGIEATAQRVQNVDQAIAIENGGKLALFYSGTASPESLLRQVRAQLPDSHWPTQAVQLLEWPMNANGKTDRAQLKDFVPKTVELLKTSIAEDLWFEILKKAPEGTEQTFFEAGGDSLNVIELSIAFETRLNREFDLTFFLQQPSLARLESMIENKDQAALQTALKVDPSMAAPWSDLVSEIQSWPQTIARFEKAKTVLLTGATGQVGARILESLLEGEKKVICLGRDLDGRIPSSSLIHLVDADFDDPQSVSRALLRLPKVDSIIHCGAHVNHVYSLETLYQANVGSTFQLLQYAHRNGVQNFVYVSSLSAHRQAETGYEISKAASESLVEAARLRGMNATSARLPLVYDNRSSCPETDHFLARVRQCLQMPTIPNDKAKIVAMEAGDCARVLTELAISEDALKPCYDFLPDSGIEWFSLIRQLHPLAQSLEYSDWRKEFYRRDPALSPLGPFRPLYKDDGALSQHFFPPATGSSVDQENFRQFVEKLAWHPKSSEQVLQQRLEGLV